MMHSFNSEPAYSVNSHPVCEINSPEYEKKNGNWTFEQDIETAEKNGMEIIRTDPFNLLIDLDGEDRLAVFETQFKILKDHLNLEEIERYRSKSGNWHVILSCRYLNIRDRLMYQCLLGSDPKREALGLMMYCDGIKSPSVLFKPR